MRRAEWRSPPDESRLIAARIARGLWGALDFGDLPAWARWPRDVGCLLLGVPMLLSPVFLTLAVDTRFGLPGSLPVALASIALIAGGYLRLAFSSRPPWDRLMALLPFPLPGGTFPVDVAVHRRRVLVGTDEAVASFVDGWLNVEGVRTGFALRPDDGRAEWRGDRLRIELPEGSSVTLRLQAVALWIARDRRPLPDNGGFAGFARAWVAAPPPVGESIMPPTTIQADVRAVWTLALFLAALVTILSVFALGR